MHGEIQMPSSDGRSRGCDGPENEPFQNGRETSSVGMVRGYLLSAGAPSPGYRSKGFGAVSFVRIFAKQSLEFIQNFWCISE
jgi:hypothetical protein